MSERDDVNHPSHYQGSNGIEAIQVIEGFLLNYNLGTANAYILRADRKGEPIKDLKKAVWHLQREIANREDRAKRIDDCIRDAAERRAAALAPRKRKAKKRGRR